MSFVPPTGTALNMGAREYQQDRVLAHTMHLSSENPLILAAAFDGHGARHANDLGHVVSEACEQNLLSYFRNNMVWRHLESRNQKYLKHALENVVEQLETYSTQLNDEHKTYAGSTLCAVMLSNEVLVSVNVGDSRAVMGMETKGRQIRSIDMTTDHVPSRSSELERIIQNGGWVEGGSLNGYISMTRALGDCDLKRDRNRTPFPNKQEGQQFGPEMFIADPEIRFFIRKPSQRFIIVATDGIWSNLKSESAVKIVHSSLKRYGDCEKAAASLIRAAINAGSTDNCGVVIVILSKVYTNLSEKKSKNVTSKLKCSLKNLRKPKVK